MRDHRLIPLTVVSNTAIRPRLHRLTFSSSEFADYNLDGPDEFFGLLMPKRGREFTPFEIGMSNIRATVAALPDEIRPDLRWYTVRSIDQAAGTITTDIVTHGDNGPGTSWVKRACAGDTAGMYTCSAIWSPTTSAQLLVADASSLPALRHILSYQFRNAPQALAQADVVAVVTDFDEVEEGLAEQWSPLLHTLTVVKCEKTLETAATLRTINDLFKNGKLLPPFSVWTCGEGGLAKAVRKEAIDEWGLSPDNVTWSPFWFHGKARP